MHKKIHILLTVIILFSISSCGIFNFLGKKNIEKQIIGKWKIVSVDLSNIDTMVRELTSYMDLTEAETKKMIEKTKADMKEDVVGQGFEFYDDNTVLISGEEEAIPWTYIKKENKILIKPEDKRSNVELIINSFETDKFNADFIVTDNDVTVKIIMDLERQ